LRLAGLLLAAALRARVDPSDLVQATFVKAVRTFAHFRGTSEKEFRAWLCSILRNKGRDIGRQHACRSKRRVAREVSLDDPGSGHDWKAELPALPALPIDEVLSQEEARVFNAALQQLPPMQYAVILLHVLGDYPFVEVGAIIECPAEAVRKLFTRAVKNLTHDLAPAS
jgi:RNA polymerase sigma-70 factor (ECF subfamily)